MPRTDRATFRLPLVALFVPGLLFFLIAPLATSGGWWAVLFVVPLAAVGWVLITRTTVTPDGMTAHGMTGAKRMTWAQLDRLEFPDARWAIAIATNGRELRLPMVRPRDLPRLTEVAGGTLRLGDDALPGEPSEDETEDQAVEDQATASTTDEHTQGAAPAGEAGGEAEPDAQPAEPRR